MSLVNVSLKLWSLNMAYMLIFLLKKMWVAFAFANATHNFFSKNTCELDIVLTRTIEILTTNELVKLMTLWTTGPWFLFYITAAGVKIKRSSARCNSTDYISSVSDQIIGPILVTLKIVYRLSRFQGVCEGFGGGGLGGWGRSIHVSSLATTTTAYEKI